MPIHPARQATVLAHAFLVPRLAAHIQRSLPVNLTNELLQAGRLGLLEAAQRFEWRETNPTFRRFAFLRVRGAMYDEIRRHDVVPVHIRRKARRMAAAGTVGECAPASAPSTCSLDTDFEEPSEIGTSPDLSPEQQYGRQQTRSILQQSFAALPDIEQFVISRYFEHEFTLLQIAAHLNVSEARVSQIKRKAIAQMKTQLAATGCHDSLDLP